MGMIKQKLTPPGRYPSSWSEYSNNKVGFKDGCATLPILLLEKSRGIPVVKPITGSTNLFGSIDITRQDPLSAFMLSIASLLIIKQICPLKP
jgi:hypothetical protein